MRVLYLNLNSNRVSTAVALEGWLGHLRHRGLRPTVVTAARGPFHTWAVAQGLDAHVVWMPWPSRARPGPFLLCLARLAALAVTRRVQVVHCVEERAYPVGQVLGRLLRLPTVVGVHLRLDRPFAKWAFAGSRRPARVYFVSRSNLEASRSAVEGIVPESAWRVLPNALDLDHYRPDPARAARFRATYGDGVSLVGTAVALRPIKQIEHMFEAVARARSRPLLLLAGSLRQPDYARELIALGERVLGDRFRYLGYLDDLRGLLNGLDLYLSTGVEEAASISVLQAMACGCPVVGYPSGGVAEEVLPGGGEIVPQDSIDALTAAIDAWLADPARLAAARPSARRRVEEAYDIRPIADGLLRDYRELLGERDKSQVSSFKSQVPGS